jgi:hypothetical protein
MIPEICVLSDLSCSAHVFQPLETGVRRNRSLLKQLANHRLDSLLHWLVGTQMLDFGVPHVIIFSKRLCFCKCMD